MSNINVGFLSGALGCVLVAAASGCTTSGTEEIASFNAMGRLGSAMEAVEAPACDIACPVDHSAVSLQDGVCVLGDGLGNGANPVVFTESLTLCPGEYLLADQLFVGAPSAFGVAAEETVLTLSPGVTIRGAAKTFLAVNRDSKLLASGSREQPIVLTSAQPVPAAGDWGGLVLNGNALINVAGGEAQGEAGTGAYGGLDNADSSGVLQHLRVEFAGNPVDAENELNGIAFQAVGSATVVEDIAVHASADDGVEFFGGTVSVSNLLLTGNQDDSIDWAEGWRGTIDGAVVIQAIAGELTPGDRGIEADSSAIDPTAEPVSNPTLIGLTLVGSADSSQGVLLRRGSRLTLIDSIISGFPTCLRVDGVESTDAALAGDIVLDNVVLNCDEPAALGDLGAEALADQPGVRNIGLLAPELIVPVELAAE